MVITLQYFDDCPNWTTTVQHLDLLVEEGLDAIVGLELIATHEGAVARGFRGSPTVLLDGIDPFADESAPFGLACRIYRTEQGLAGSPSLSQLRDAISAAQKRS
jgi:hypothetical protein